MCERCADTEAAPHAKIDATSLSNAGTSPSTSRRKLWEMTDGWHCSVIGTCLTLADLRGLGRKLKLKVESGFPQDYQLHGYFVQESNKNETAGKLLNKLLDKRHAAAIRRARELVNDEQIKAYWDGALEAGDIPGPYWALLSHPNVSPKFCEHMFAEVHMLSHLVGASNRADIRRLQALEDENDALKSRMRRMVHRHRDRIAAKNVELEAVQAEAQRARPAIAAQSLCPAVQREAKSEPQPNVVEALEHSIARSVAHAQDQERQIAELTALVEELKNENDALEVELAEIGDEEEPRCPFDLGGQCLLYVGGRKPAVNRLRALVETWNGELIHHDGGLEKSFNELASAVVRADAVVFPTDCVSHAAADKVKKLCRQTMKPYVPLRSGGVGSLIAGLQSSFVADLAIENGDPS